MSMESLNNNHHNLAPKNRSKIKATVGVVALTGVALVSWQLFDKSGDIEKVIPTKPIPEEIDQHHNQLSWNMRLETSRKSRQIEKLIKAHQIDVAMLQEVKKEDLKSLSQQLPNMYITFVMADLKSNTKDGGFGNALITRQEPKDTKSKSFPGSGFLSGITLTSVAMAEGGASLDVDGMKEAKDVWQADRSAVATTISVRQNDKREDVRVITSHIAGNEKVHEKQLKGLLGFIETEVKQGRPTIFCGDLNDSPENIIPRFAEIGFITPTTGGTWAGPSHNTIDYCAYNSGTVLGLGTVAVLNEPKTDHYPLVGSWTSR